MPDSCNNSLHLLRGENGYLGKDHMLFTLEFRR